MLGLDEKVWARFEAKVDWPAAWSACWNWIACLNHAGYGKLGIQKKTQLAHRVSYELLVGPIPEGLTLDHLCRVRRCVNPLHLEPVTMGVNLRRGIAPPALNAVKTHCPQGHEYTEANTYRYHRGPWVMRKCRACHRIRQAARKAAARGVRIGGC